MRVNKCLQSSAEMLNEGLLDPHEWLLLLALLASVSIAGRADGSGG